MAEDIIRVLRIVEYVGPRSCVESEVSKSIHGARQFTLCDKEGKRQEVRITAVTVGEFAEVISDQAVKFLFQGQGDPNASSSSQTEQQAGSEG